MSIPDLRTFEALAREGNVVALSRRLMSDQLTPVLAYRRLVAPDQRTAPSFLLESVETGGRVGRYSFLGAQPTREVAARGHEVTVTDHRTGAARTSREDDPLMVPRRLGADLRPVGRPVGGRFCGGWVGYAGYDTVRYTEPGKLPFDAAPADDRHLPDLHFGFYPQVAVFDHVDKTLTAVSHVLVDEHPSLEAAWESGRADLEAFVERLETPSVRLPAGAVDLDPAAAPTAAAGSTFTRPDFEEAVRRCQAYIAAGDAFQIVLSQRFRRESRADPFEIYRALRIVNPSPYMIYLQARGSILVASSPEILCRAEGGVVTSRPLAGTRRRGRTAGEDAALADDLRADEKERAEHVMLVDLARNDVGRVCALASVRLERLLEVERYSHVMHLSSTVTGRVRAGLDGWDALRATLPVGTVSGAPKVRAMQIIDELEPVRRGPYAGGIGVIGLDGDADVAIALRTMVVPTEAWRGGPWRVDLQAGAGIVVDSDPAAEYDETVSKAAALGRAIDLAEHAFGPRPG
ncbi:MAG: anthranilate synthase component I [Planctomycetota bacterium]|jgi:anthranilate synthase component 1